MEVLDLICIRKIPIWVVMSYRLLCASAIGIEIHKSEFYVIVSFAYSGFLVDRKWENRT
jgi:hypothetical protein